MTSYEKSNKILTVGLNKFNNATYKKLLADKGDREENSQNLLDYLCDKFKLPRVRVVIADQARRISGRCETRGFITSLVLCRVSILKFTITLPNNIKW